FYNLVINFFEFAGRFATFFNSKAAKFFKGRRGLFRKLELAMMENSAQIAWFHCASLGEFEQGRPVIEAFRKSFPAYKVLLTFFSPSGYEVRKNYDKAEYIFYLPIDTSANARHFIQLVNPAIAFFVKYEFWHNLISEAEKNNTPLIGFSMIFRPGSIFFKSYGAFYRGILNRFDHIFVQDEKSYQLLQRINFSKSSIGGDTRFDRVYQVCSNPNHIPVAASLAKNQRVMVMGSTWPSDMDVLYDTINDESLPLKYIIAPHNISDGELDHMERKINRSTIRYSRAKAEEMKKIDVLLIDNIGMLSSLYQYGELAYIGGAFRKALHNTLEAATFGLPVLFGDDETNRKFKEAIDLQQKGAAIALPHRADQIKQEIRQLMADDERRKRMGAIAGDYVKSNIGASGKVIDLAKKLLS
ncbi:MAG: 3-deoxy-D-manno-octulosonic acid transferase, partial [Cyclobacteriaceae bacterium]